MNLLPPIQVYEEPKPPWAWRKKLPVTPGGDSMKYKTDRFMDHSFPDFGPADPIARYLSETFLATATKTEAVKRMAEQCGMKL